MDLLGREGGSDSVKRVSKMAMAVSKYAQTNYRVDSKVANQVSALFVVLLFQGRKRR